MFTTDSGFGWHATPKPFGTVRVNGRTVIISPRGIERLAERLAGGEPVDEAVCALLYGAERDFGHDVVGWWHFRGRKNPWRIVGQVQICRTIEYGEVHYTATSMITDHTSPTLAHLLSRLTQLQHGALKRERDRKGTKRKKQKPRRAVSEGEVWARRHEEGWGPGGY